MAAFQTHKNYMWVRYIYINLRKNFSPPVSLVVPLLPVAPGCLCRPQLPLALSVQQAQCFPFRPEMQSKTNGFQRCEYLYAAFPNYWDAVMTIKMTLYIHSSKNKMTHLQTELYSQICLSVQLGPHVPSVQLDPKHKCTGLLLIDTNCNRL